jgi:hypothetical protein
VIADDLTSAISDFSTLVGLVLVLITLFTQQRHDKLRQRRAEPTTVAEAVTEVFLDVTILAATTAIFVFGLRLWWDAVTQMHPFRSGADAAQGVYVVAWILLVGLMIWQLILVAGATKLALNIRAARRPLVG